MIHHSIRTRPAPDLDIPEMFSRLRDIVYNLWWTWSPDAHRLFYRLAPAAWRLYRNPIDVLIDLGVERWHMLQDDDDFARDYHRLVEQFDAYVRPGESTWFDRRHGDYDAGPFAYFCAEFGWHECLHFYSGGLGILAGDHCKSASDLGLPFVGVGLMYKHGYFRQSIDAEGFQQHFYPDYDPLRLPLLPVVKDDGKDLFVAFELGGRTLHLRVWRALVGRVPILLLDSDLPINHPADRPITAILYVRGREMRLCQELVLGLGGAQTLEALGIEPAVWHINEGHSAVLQLRRLERSLARERRPLPEALAALAANTVFTTHTPVPAGNESFDAPMVRRYLEPATTRFGVDLDEIMALGRTEDGPESFNLTALALRTSSRVNGVSELHGQVANDMWHSLISDDRLAPFGHVTNGMHAPSWVGPDVRALLAKHLGPACDEAESDDDFAERVEAIPDYELWTAHRSQKQRLLTLLRDLTQEQLARHGRSPGELREVDDLLDPDALTIGFARRFATYKRADLILRDPERLKTLVADPQRPVQLVFAGKAHSADRPGQDLIRRIYQASRSPELRGRILFVESYDMRIGRHLVQGVDLWLNTPRRPHEASGTSGMKAAANGVLNCSILDGWWCEAYDESLGWAFGSTDNGLEESVRDGDDADALYRVLEEQIVPTYYRRNEQGLPAEWIRRMKHSVAQLTRRFSSTRMVREYVERCYLPAGRSREHASRD